MKTSVLLFVLFAFLGKVSAQEAQDATCLNKKDAFYMSVKTNMLYDVALIPNLGIEFSLGKNFSILGNYMYAWWSNSEKHRYWRTYGGDLELRKWFGSKAKQKPLTGHHVGIYVQGLTYDFELGGRGYIADEWNYGGGVSYGYSAPIAKRLNIDFSVGLGYIHGKYKEYLPLDGHNAWQLTKMRNWIGPTKVEVSLVWLIGKGNTNTFNKKGGSK